MNPDIIQARRRRRYRPLLEPLRALDEAIRNRESDEVISHLAARLAEARLRRGSRRATWSVTDIPCVQTGL